MQLVFLSVFFFTCFADIDFNSGRFYSESTEDATKHILFHLRPKQYNESLIKLNLDKFIYTIDAHFNESNLTSFYDFIKHQEPTNYLGLSIYHNWGLGIAQEPRMGVLFLNLGVIEKDSISLMSHNYKSYFAINLPKTCDANIDSLKSTVDDVARNFFLFERKDSGFLKFVNKEMENSDGNMAYEILDNMEEIGRLNMKQLNNFFQYYLTSSTGKTSEITTKIIRYLENSFSKTMSYESATYLGLFYLESSEVNQEKNKKAKMYFELGASQNIPHSFLGLGLIYFYGLGTDIDYETSFKYFVRANKSGLVQASTYIGICYLAGLGVVADTKQAELHIMLAANRGYLLAIYTLGFMHQKGIGVFRSCRHAFQMYSVILEQKLLKYYVSSAVIDYQNNHRLRAFFKFLLFSEMGSSYSLINAAHIAEKNSFSFYSYDQRMKNVFKLWNLASAQGNAKAVIKVGDFYYYGLGVKQDYVDAFDSYQSAAMLYQDPEAMFNIAYMYEHGLGVTRNFYTAERFYAIASKLEMNAKMLISLVLFRIRIKSIWQTIINSIKAFINLFMSIFSTTLIEAISKNGFDLIVEERETIFIIMAAIIIVIITRTHLH